MPFVTLCVTIDAAPRTQERTQSVRKGVPTRSMGTMVFSRTPVVPHIPAQTPIVPHTQAQTPIAPHSSSPDT
ncbi:hypothetical protein CCL24_11740 [Pseudomonas congelans]|nr:hypothetical protein CCL24_11740 [Pseudomonas congelans]